MTFLVSFLHGYLYSVKCHTVPYMYYSPTSCYGNRYTVWPEILAGNLFWRIGSFEINPPISVTV